jgi:cytoskeletal protein CcmA (bactofilin family)
MAFLGGSKKENTSASVDVALNNIIGKGTTVKGEIEATGNIRIEGMLEGNIRSKAKAVFGESAHMKGNVYAQNAEIAGKVDGTVHIADTLVLKPSALINGDIFTGNLIVEQGAKFNGKCEMTKSTEVKTNTAPTEQKAK